MLQTESRENEISKFSASLTHLTEGLKVTYIFTQLIWQLINQLVSNI